MCAFYENGIDKIKQGDLALYKNKRVKITQAKHIKTSKTMLIEYKLEDKLHTLSVPYKTVIKEFVKLNEMGQATVAGYECKPKDFDANRAIMHYKYQIYICDDKRCANAAKSDRAKELRDILKSMELNQGKDRIKISKSKCFGACRYRQVAQINANTNANGLVENNALWLKHTHRFELEKWKKIFTLLANNGILKKHLDSKDFIEMKVYE